jgi:hypothetical protein
MEKYNRGKGAEVKKNLKKRKKAKQNVREKMIAAAYLAEGVPQGKAVKKLYSIIRCFHSLDSNKLCM